MPTSPDAADLRAANAALFAAAALLRRTAKALERLARQPGASCPVTAAMASRFTAEALDNATNARALIARHLTPTTPSESRP